VKATFIGGGNMATALAGGLLARGVHPADLRVVEPLAAQRERLRERMRGVAVHSSASGDALKGAEVVVFAVKPQQMREAVTAIAPHVAAIPVVLTIAAGVRCADIARWLGGYARIVRAMPNTPALVGAGISALYATPDAKPVAKVAADVLEACGEILWCDDERDLDAVTAVSGSGPAYVFYFLEALEQAAIELGLPPGEARRLAYATFDGSMRLARASSDAPAKLRANVTSKGGTTAAAIGVLDAAGVGERIVLAVKAAAARATELGDAYGKD